jgi:hypothetical protein
MVPSSGPWPPRRRLSGVDFYRQEDEMLESGANDQLLPRRWPSR